MKKAQAIDYARSISSSFFSSLGISELNPMNAPVTNITTENQNESFYQSFFYFMECYWYLAQLSDLLMYLFLAAVLWGVIDIALSWKKKEILVRYFEELPFLLRLSFSFLVLQNQLM